ncbi:hypothetical protein ACFOWX_01730 [Sphingorhabdus arenilitoris]|uniref:DUF4189 domain-containing protein n=1 Tax=Sphingorhabdus arenilitoris TaxID=1490041 RepID=A0ABV8RDW1_9SPHN
MTRLLKLSALSGLCAISAIAAQADAKSKAEPERATERWSFLITYGDENCPQAADDEIVVCAERPEAERYRIPANVYQKPKLPHTGDRSLAAATESLDDVARLARPSSCSAVGSNGFTGCQAKALREWFAERREDGVR